MRAARTFVLTGVSLAGVVLTASAAVAGPAHPQTRPGVVLGSASGPAAPTVIAAKKNQTTVGGGYLSRPGVAHEAQTYVTTPAVTCGSGGAYDGPRVILGAFGFQADGSLAASASVVSACQDGMPLYFVDTEYSIDNQFHAAIQDVSAGDLIEIDLEEDSSQTYMDAYDTTSGADAQLTDSAYPTEDTQLLIGSLSDSPFLPVADFGSTTFYDPSFNSEGITSALATKLTQYTSGVAQIKTKNYNKKKQRFSLVWEHS